MKHTKMLNTRLNLYGLVLALAALVLSSFVASATPYAAGLINYGTNNNTGDIGFFLNEAGSTVTVIYDDGTTNANFDGIVTGLNVPRGSNHFNLAGHNGYRIQVYKLGTGAPSKISVDTDFGSMWANPRGITVNQNPKIGSEFGRIYGASGGTGGYTTGNGYKNYGIYALNPDFSIALGNGTNSYGSANFPIGPWRLRVCPKGTGLDNQVMVTRNFSTSVSGDTLYLYSPDLSTSTLLLAGVGKAAGLIANAHSDGMFDAPVLTGSLSAGNLKLWITETDWAAVPSWADFGPNTGSGMYNLLLRFDINSGPIPPTGVVGPPGYAYTVGLEGIANLRPMVEIGQDGKIFAGFGRANNSNPNLVALDPTGHTFLYMSGLSAPYFSQDTATPSLGDPWNGYIGANAQVGMYGGVRVSPDGKYIAAQDINSGLAVANLVGGIPDDTTIFQVPNGTLAANGRGLDWDAAGNLYESSSGQLLNRAYTLGGTTTCVTSNDWTGTNGTFSVVLPPVLATINITQPYASQNYGTPIAGIARLALSTNNLSTPMTVSFSRSGTSFFSTNSATTFYKIAGANTIINGFPTNAPYGVTVGTNSVTFPAGAFAGPGNFFVDISIIPTALPVSTNTQTVVLGLSNPSAYQFGSPSKGTIFIQNTGPQLLILAPAANGSTMYRGVTNDYAEFTITRYGDTNGPGNSASSINPKAYTVTNLTYSGTAVFPTDYTARAQRIDSDLSGKVWGNNFANPPQDGPTAIIFYPGDQAVTCMIGNPVIHTNLNNPPVNVTVGLVLPSGTSQEGTAYTSGTATAQTLTIVDNAVGPEVVLWSDSMTNAANALNYTLTYAGTNFGQGALPVVYPNYTNYMGSHLGGSTNDFEVLFGSDISTNYYYDVNPNAGGSPIPVPPAPLMLISNWPQKALKMTVNKIDSTICGVNVYPHQSFGGNYALRFSMFLSIYRYYIDDPYITQNYREYATFGVNHYGTNCIWRPSTTMITGSGMTPTNSDGCWFAVDSGYLGITPADLEVYLPGPVPNDANPYGVNGGLRGWNSWSASSATPQGYLKHPPFAQSSQTEATRTIAAPGGGQPVNRWVDMSVEITGQTNIQLYLNRSTWLGKAAITNGIGFGSSYTNGTIMLGYDDPDRTVSDSSAFVYYSNVRVVELSPYISLLPTLTNTMVNNMIRIQGSSLVLTTAVNYASAPITGAWYKASAATLGINGGTLSYMVQSNWFNANFANDSLALNNVAAADATNYVYVARDPAGTVTSPPVDLDVFLTPTNQIAVVGQSKLMSMRVAGPIAPTSYQWMTNGLSLVASAHYLTDANGGTNVTMTNLNIVNVQPSDALTYGFKVVHPDQTLTQFVNLTVVGLIAPASQTVLWGSSPTFSVTASGATPAYIWRKNGTAIPGATSSSLTLANCTTNDAATYSCVVTNPGTGSGTLLSSGVLTVSVPPPVFGVPTQVGGNIQMLFSSPNNGNDYATNFVLQAVGVLTQSASGVLSGPWTNVTGATFVTNTPPSGFQVTAPMQGDSIYYRLVHQTP